jgi:SulP family sulfate permease
MSTLATFIQTPVAQLKIYFTQSWNSDLIASLTVAKIAIPQSMAYASIAGVNPIYGL